MLNIVIVDDNDVLLSSLVNLVDSCMNIPHMTSAFSSVSEVAAYAQEDKIDILITDIKMPIINGVDLAQMLRNIHPAMQTIFISNYTTYVEDAFGAAPVYYLLKPITEERLKNALDLAVQQIQRANETLSIIVKGKAENVPIRSIKYLESRERYVYIYCADECIQLLAKLDEIQRQLPIGFIRPHKSYLVNLSWVKSISNYKIKLLNGIYIPCAKSRHKTVKEQIIKFWGGKL